MVFFLLFIVVFIEDHEGIANKKILRSKIDATNINKTMFPNMAS